MFFDFSSSILDIINSNDEFQKNELLKVLYNATDSIIKRRHYISCENFDVAEQIYNFCRERDKKNEANLFFHIYEKLSMIACVKDELKFYICIGNFEKDIEINGNHISVNYKLAKNEFFFDRPFFIPEDLLDKKYFDAICKHEQLHIHNSTLKTLNYDFRKDHGGGGKTYDLFIERINEGSPILVILDSDKKTPTSSFGGTADKFLADDVNKKLENYFFLILNVHEMENLYSSEYFLKKSGYARKSYEKLRHFDSVDTDARLYFDIKMGYNYKEYLNNDYIKSLYGEFDKSSLCEKDCNNCNLKKCKVTVLQGNTHYLEHLFTNINNTGDIENEINKGYSGLIAKIKDEWKKIFIYMITVGCFYDESITGVN